MMEKIVRDIVEDLFSMEEMDICKCDKCKADVIALALNNLPPKYVVTEKGRIFTELEAYTFQFRADVLKAVVEAMEIVRKNPRPDDIDCK